MKSTQKVALIHDYLNQWGGAERVLWSMHELFPEAPIYTLLWDAQRAEKSTTELRRFTQTEVTASWLQGLPKWLRHSRLLLPLYPTAIEQLDLTEYDLVISDSSAFSKGVITRPDTVHICYCHTPTRYLWDWHERYLAEQHMGWFKKTLTVPILSYLRVWDRFAADRVDHFIANSQEVQRRIRKYYGRDSVVIYPPVPVRKRVAALAEREERARKLEYDGTEQDEGYYLIVSRLSGYKSINLAIDACNRLQVKLKIVGEGRDLKELRLQAWSNVEFLGHIRDEALAEVYRRSRALIMPGIEDFGMVMVEALSYGKPVIAFQGGGALEIVKEGVSGMFFRKPTVYALMDALRAFDDDWCNGKYQPRTVAETVDRFDEAEFKRQMRELVEAKTSSHEIITSKKQQSK
jgi:glycosyltransferase involved in cell wall biosynthesis